MVQIFVFYNKNYVMRLYNDCLLTRKEGNEKNLKKVRSYCGLHFVLL